MEPQKASPSATPRPYPGDSTARDPDDERTLADRTRQLASDARRRASSQVRTELDNGRQRAADALHHVADSLLNGTRDVTDGPARYLRDASEQVRRAADWLEHSDTQELTMRAEDFARRQPALFLGSAFAMGLVAARFFKSSTRGTTAPRRLADRGPVDGLTDAEAAPSRSATTPPFFADADLPSKKGTAREGGR